MCLFAGTENCCRLCTNGLTVRTQSLCTECWRLLHASALIGPSVFVASGFSRIEAVGGMLGDSVSAVLRHTNQVKHTEQNEGQQPLPVQPSYSKGVAGTSKGPQLGPVPELLPGLDVHAKHQEFRCWALLHPSVPFPPRCCGTAGTTGAPSLGSQYLSDTRTAACRWCLSRADSMALPGLPSSFHTEKSFS